MKRKSNIFDHALAQRASRNPHEHPARKFLQRAAGDKFERSKARDEIIESAASADDVLARPALTEAEWEQFRTTVEVQQFTAKMADLLHGGVVLKLAQLNPLDHERALDEIDAGSQAAERSLADVRGERLGAEHVARRANLMFATQEMPAFQEFLDGLMAMVRGRETNGSHGAGRGSRERDTEE